MIRIICNECNEEIEIIGTRHYGISEITLLIESCGCEKEKEGEVGALIKTNEELHQDIETLEERVEEITDNYDRLERESRKLKWMAKHNDLWWKYEDMKEKAEEWEGNFNREAELHKKTVRLDIEAAARRRSESNVKFDALEIKYSELATKHKKMVFKYDKLTAEHNGGDYKRSVDL